MIAAFSVVEAGMFVVVDRVVPRVDDSFVCLLVPNLLKVSSSFSNDPRCMRGDDHHHNNNIDVGILARGPVHPSVASSTFSSSTCQKQQCSACFRVNDEPSSFPS